MKLDRLQQKLPLNPSLSRLLPARQGLFSGYDNNSEDFYLFILINFFTDSTEELKWKQSVDEGNLRPSHCRQVGQCFEGGL